MKRLWLAVGILALGGRQTFAAPNTNGVIVRGAGVEILQRELDALRRKVGDVQIACCGALVELEGEIVQPGALEIN